MQFLTSQFSGKEIWNEYQLSIHREVKLEVFLFFPSTEKKNLKLNCISNWNFFGICINVYCPNSKEFFSYILNIKTWPKPSLSSKKRFLGCLHFVQKLGLLIKHVGKFRSHCSREREEPGSSEVIAHGNGKNREVQKSLLTGTGRTGKFRSHCSREREEPGSSEVIAHGNGKNRKV